MILAAGSASAETTLERIRASGEMSVGTEAAFPPFEFVEDGNIVGYGKDILDAVVQSMPNVAVLIKETPEVFALAGPATEAQR